MERLKSVAKAALGRRQYPARYDQIYEAIEATAPRRILEIGTNDGLNAVRMVEHAREIGGVVTYFGFDLFEAQEGTDLDSEFSLPTQPAEKVSRMLRRRGVENHHLYEGDTIDTLPETVPELPAMDLIFIDGGHSEPTVASDWKNVQPLIHDESLIFFDDYPNWGVGPVVDRIDRDAWDVEILPVTDRFTTSVGEGERSTVREFQLALVRPGSTGR